MILRLFRKRVRSRQFGRSGEASGESAANPQRMPEKLNFSIRVPPGKNARPLPGERGGGREGGFRDTNEKLTGSDFQ